MSFNSHSVVIQWLFIVIQLLYVSIQLSDHCLTIVWPLLILFYVQKNSLSFNSHSVVIHGHSVVIHGHSIVIHEHSIEWPLFDYCVTIVLTIVWPLLLLFTVYCLLPTALFIVQKSFQFRVLSFGLKKFKVYSFEFQVYSHSVVIHSHSVVIQLLYVSIQLSDHCLTIVWPLC